MEIDQLEREVCVAGRVFGDLLSHRDLNTSLLKLILEYWPSGASVISDRARKAMNRIVRDEYLHRYTKTIEGSIEPIIRALVLSTIWWWNAHPQSRELFLGGHSIYDRGRCC